MSTGICNLQIPLILVWSFSLIWGQKFNMHFGWCFYIFKPLVYIFYLFSNFNSVLIVSSSSLSSSFSSKSTYPSSLPYISGLYLDYISGLYRTSLDYIWNSYICYITAVTKVKILKIRASFCYTCHSHICHRITVT